MGGGDGVKKRKEPGRRRRILTCRRPDWFAFVFLAPWLIGLVLFVCRPLIQSFYYALCDVKVTGSGRILTFLGFENFASIWVKDIAFLRRELNFLLSTVLQVPIVVIFALLAALMLNSQIRGKGIFRTIFFLPVIVVSGPLINELSNQGVATIPLLEQQGILDTLSAVLPDWLVSPISGLFSRLIMILWYSGIPILMFLAILQKIDLNMLEAARIDGATGWEIFWKITLPAIRPIMLLNAVYTLVYLANADGNGVINLISNAMLQVTRGYGYAAAMAWTHTVIVVFLLALAFLLLKGRSDKAARKQRL